MQEVHDLAYLVRFFTDLSHPRQITNPRDSERANE